MTVSVKINGVEASDVLEGLSITYGRQKSEGSFPASSCSFALLAADISPFEIAIRDVLTIDIDGVRAFYGRVTDRSRSIAYADDTRVGTFQNVIATGVLADFGRITVGASDWPAESDGVRAGRILGEAAPAAPNIDMISNTIDSIAYTLDVFRSQGIDIVDGGTVSLIARTGSAKTPRSLIDTDLNPAAPGVYETPSGSLGYADALRRLKATDQLTIPASYIGQDLRIASGVSDVVNQAVVKYGTSGLSEMADEPLSQSIFGVVKREFTTQLANTTDANDVAKRLVETRSFAEDNLEALPIDLENPDVHPSVRGALLATSFGRPIKVTGLDERIGLGTEWRGFVEGWTVRISKARHELVLYVSARRFSIPLSTIDPIWTKIDALTGSINELADLWSAQLSINYVSDTINSVTGTYDAAYTIGA